MINEVKRITSYQFLRYLSAAIDRINPDKFPGCPPEAVNQICRKLEKMLNKQHPLIVIKQRRYPIPNNRFFNFGDLIWVDEQDCNTPSKMYDWLFDAIPAMIRARLPKMWGALAVSEVSIDGVTIKKTEETIHSTFCCYSSCNNRIDDIWPSTVEQPNKHEDKKCHTISSLGCVTDLFISDELKKRMVSWPFSSGELAYYSENEGFIRVLQATMDKDNLELILKHHQITVKDEDLDNFCQRLKQKVQTEGIKFPKKFWDTDDLNDAIFQIYQEESSLPLTEKI